MCYPRLRHWPGRWLSAGSGVKLADLCFDRSKRPGGRVTSPDGYPHQPVMLSEFGGIAYVGSGKLIKPG